MNADSASARRPMVRGRTPLGAWAVGALLVAACGTGGPADAPPAAPAPVAPPVQAQPAPVALGAPPPALVGAGPQLLAVAGRFAEGQVRAPTPDARAVAAWPDGRWAALGADGGLTVGGLPGAPLQAALPAASRGEGQPSLLADPDGEHLWVLTQDRRRATRHALQPGLPGGLVVPLSEDPTGQVAAVGHGALVLARGARLTGFAGRGQRVPVPRASAEPIARIAPAPEGGVWALEAGGRLVRIHLKSGAELAAVQLGGDGVALASDARGPVQAAQAAGQGKAAVAIPAHGEVAAAVAGPDGLTLYLVGADGTVRWQVPAGEGPGDLALTDQQVVWAGPEGLGRWARADGAPLP